MAQIDGIIFTRPNKKHSEGFRVYDTYDRDDIEYIGWSKTWIGALKYYHERMTDTDGECNLLIFKCRPTNLPCLWGKVEFLEKENDEDAEIELLSRLH